MLIGGAFFVAAGGWLFGQFGVKYQDDILLATGSLEIAAGGILILVGIFDAVVGA